jgi:hypothetical protein
LRIIDSNPLNKKQWWFYDSRTRTVRPESRRNFVLANQLGSGFKKGVAAVIRPYIR